MKVLGTHVSNEDAAKAESIVKKHGRFTTKEKKKIRKASKLFPKAVREEIERILEAQETNDVQQTNNQPDEERTSKQENQIPLN